MVLSFLNSTYAFLMVVIGVIGLIMGINRILKKEEEESKMWQWLGGICGLLLLAIVIIVSINRFDSSSTNEAAFITNYTILFGILSGMSYIARPFKKVPIAFAFAIIFSLVLLYVAMVVRDYDATLFNAIPLQYILLGGAIIVLIIFIVSFVQERALDSFLWVLSWGSLVVILSLILILQGITLLVDWPEQGGILTLLPG